MSAPVWGLDCGDPIGEAIALAVPLLAGLAAYRCAPWRNRGGWITLCVAWAVLALGSALNLHWWTVANGGTLDTPRLDNSDAHLLFYSAKDAMEALHSGNYGLFREMILCGSFLRPFLPFYLVLFKLFGVSLLPVTAFNMSLLLIAAVAGGTFCARILRRPGGTFPGRILTAAMIMLLCTAYWFNSGTLLIKDAMLQCVMAVAILSLTVVWQPCRKSLHNTLLLCAFILSLVFMVASRIHLLEFIAVAGLFMVRRGNIRRVLAALGIIGVVYVLGMIVTSDPGAFLKVISVDDNIAGYYFQERPMQMPYLRILGNYLEWPVWQRVLWLPVSCAVQFLIPLPWNGLRDLAFGPTLVYAHQGWAWYLIGGAALGYLFIYSWRRRQRGTAVARWTWWGAAMFCVPALMYAGTVSRYFLPMMPVYVAGAIWCIRQARKDRAFIIWYGCYAVVLVSALACAFALSD